jgi:hypothetical protein
MKWVTALMPLALALYGAVNWLVLVTSGKVTFSWQSPVLYALGLLGAGCWAMALLRRAGGQ